MSMTMIATETIQNRGRAVGVLTRAFAEDPAVRWLFPDEGAYRFHFPAFVYALAGSAFAHGTATR